MKKDFRTELGKVRGLGTAKEGTEHFWLQRVTAFANVLGFCAFLIVIVASVGKDYASVHAIIGNPIVAVITALMVISALYHMKLGMQVILEDYFPHEGTRMVFLAFNIFFCFAVGAMCILALLKISLGS